MTIVELNLATFQNTVAKQRGLIPHQKKKLFSFQSFNAKYQPPFISQLPVSIPVVASVHCEEKLLDPTDFEETCSDLCHFT